MKTAAKKCPDEKSKTPGSVEITIDGVKMRLHMPRDRKGLIPMARWREAMAAVVATRKKPIFAK